MRIYKGYNLTSYTIGGVNGQDFQIRLQIFKNHGGWRLSFDFNTNLLIKIFRRNCIELDFTRGY